MKLALRDYQVAAHDAPLKAWGFAPWYNGEGDTFRSTIANLATSAGKTIIAGAIAITAIEQLGMRVMFMADSDELCQQPLDKFRRLGLHAALEKAQDRAPSGVKCVVASAQTLAGAKRLDSFQQRWRPDVIIVDECHRASPRNKRITDAFPDAKLLGLTATAFRSGLADLSDFYEHVCFELGTFNLIDAGYISPIRVQPLPISIDLTTVRSEKKFGESDYSEQDLDEAITPYYEQAAEGILTYAKDMPTVTFLPLVRSSQRFVEVLKHHGISAKHVDGNSEDRKEILTAFEAGEFQVISNSMLLTTGWDVPPCRCLLNLRPTKSVGLFRQQVGRIIRVLDGVIDGLATPEERHAAIASSAKPWSLILDPLWQTASMGLVGPANLIVQTAEEAEKLTKRERKKETDWDVAEEFRKMKEEELADRLRAMAEKQRKQLLAIRRGDLAPIDATQLAGMFHQAMLLNFEPVSRWERMPISDGQRGRLEKEGIDLATVKNKGHASKIIDAIEERKRKGLVGPKTVMVLKSREISDAEAENCTLEKAEALVGEKFWSFGKYKGRPLSQAPASYCRWIAEQGWLDKFPEADYVRQVTEPQPELEL